MSTIVVVTVKAAQTLCEWEQKITTVTGCYRSRQFSHKRLWQEVRSLKANKMKQKIHGWRIMAFMVYRTHQGIPSDARLRQAKAGLEYMKIDTDFSFDERGRHQYERLQPLVAYCRPVGQPRRLAAGVD